MLQKMGVKEIYKVGGAILSQLLFLGLKLLKVDKIVGPGNVYVAAAKEVLARLVLIWLQGPLK